MDTLSTKECIDALATKLGCEQHKTAWKKFEQETAAVMVCRGFENDKLQLLGYINTSKNSREILSIWFHPTEDILMEEWVNPTSRRGKKTKKKGTTYPRATPEKKVSPKPRKNTEKETLHELQLLCKR